MSRRRPTHRSDNHVPALSLDKTINLVESDLESVIEETPPKLTSGRSRLKSEDSVIFVAKTTATTPVSRKARKRKVGASADLDQLVFIDDEPQPATSRNNSSPDLIEPEYFSLNTGLAAKRPRKAVSNNKSVMNPIQVDDDDDNVQIKPTVASRKRKQSQSRKPKNLQTQAKSGMNIAGNASLINNNNSASPTKAAVTKKVAAKRKTPAKSKTPEVPKLSVKPSFSNFSGSSSSNQFDDNDDCVVVWDSADVLCVYHNIAPTVAQNLINLFDNDNTIPFIARYRRGLTNNMEAEQLRVVRDAYEELKTVKEKSKAALTKVRQLGKLTKSVKKSILSAKSVAELEETMAQFKALAKGTLAERARTLGLEEPAMKLLQGDDFVNAQDYVVRGKEGLSSVAEVNLGMQHIIAEAISKQEEVLEFMRGNHKRHLILKSQKMRASKKVANADKKKLEKNLLKFQEFFNYSMPIRNIKPHTAMALNRGEKLKILSIKIDCLPAMKNAYLSICYGMLDAGKSFPLRRTVCSAAFHDAWDRLVLPTISRHTRSELTKTGEKESLDVFANNLKQILLMPPLKGATVLGIDPGFLNGCKIAVVSSSGEVLETDVIYPPFSKGGPIGPASEKLLGLITKCKVKVIALGDGTASAETSAWLGRLIGDKYFYPAEVSYTVVAESGASIYSCSSEAKEEFPNLDPNIISAVSIARRLQEPLAELVKIDPKNLGIGMYQHDLPDAKLKLALDEVVQECVSFVGVDLNTASLYLLRRVAGLSESKAKCLLQWRKDNGPFTSRQQLLEVKGIGPKAFEQCAGFVRIIGSSRAGLLTDSKVPSKSKVKQEKGAMPNLLDSTNVHPEAYTSACELLKLAGAQLEDLGKPEFQTKLTNYVEREGASKLFTKLGLEDEQAVTQLTEALTQGPAYDIRVQNRGPVFRQGFTSIADIKIGDVFTGSVQNVTTFGAFVDIGVGTSGLIHISRMGGHTLLINQRVEVQVYSIEVARKRIGLNLKV